MAYTPITFVADELLTSTKMNLMAANDASFRDGSGITNNAITLRHIADASISSSKLDLISRADSVDINTAIDKSIFSIGFFGSGCSNVPTGYVFIMNLPAPNSGGQAKQIAYSLSSNTMYGRNFFNGSWSAWSTY